MLQSPTTQHLAKKDRLSTASVGRMPDRLTFTMTILLRRASSTHGNSLESFPKLNFRFFFFYPTKKRDTQRTVRPVKMTVFSRLSRFKEECQYASQCTQFWQAWQNLCALWLSVCVCVCEVLITVLRGPSQHQISVFISLWNTVSLWMLTVWCLLNDSHPPTHTHTRVLCLRLRMCSSARWCACVSVRARCSLCVVSPNWGSNTAVLSLAFPSFSPVSAS